MKRIYIVFGALLLFAYAWSEAAGWELALSTRRGLVPTSARTAGGFRSYHFWSGGK